MKKLLNTLYVTKNGSWISHEGESVVVKSDENEIIRLPIHNLGSIVCIGHINCTAYLLNLCGERDVAVSFLSENGRFLARVSGPISGNVLLRREQYRRTEDVKRRLLIAKNIVLGKISNQRALLQRALRDHGSQGGAESVEFAIIQLQGLLIKIQDCASLDELLGI